MNARLLLSTVSCTALLTVTPVFAAPIKARPSSNVKSDLDTPEQRQVTVKLGTALATALEIPAVSPDAKTPFSPPGFDKPDPSEKRGLPPPPVNAGPAAKPTTSRDILELIAARVNSTSSVTVGGVTSLFVKLPNGSQKRLKVGDKLTINFEGSDYELEIAAIDSTTFTLRLYNEKITRPIKSGKPK